MRNLYFISYQLTNPASGGEHYNAVLVEGAKKAGLNLINWQFASESAFGQRALIINLKLLLRSLVIPRDSIVVVDVDFCSRFTLALPVMRFFRRVPVVGMLHHYRYRDRPVSLKRTVIYLMERLASIQCSFVITNSKDSLAHFRLLAGPRARAFVLAPFVRDTPDDPVVPAQFSAQPIRLITVGAIEPRKNMLAVIEATALLRLPVKYDIVGRVLDEHYANQLRECIEKHSLQSVVTLHGRVDSDVLARMLSESTLFILVSTMEGYGMAYGEAMKYALPIVATTRGAVSELVVDGENGLLREPEDINGIAAAITKLSDPETWLRVSNLNGEKYRSLMDKQTFVTQASEIFKRIAAETTSEKTR